MTHLADNIASDGKKETKASGKKRALIVQGGGLRGAYAVGALRALYDAEWQPKFDAIYAASSGAFSASYFVAHQVQEMEDTWSNLLHGSQMINYGRVFSSRPILDLDYLIRLFQNEVLLDVERIHQSPIDLHYVLTDYVTGEPRYCQPERGKIFQQMLASSSLPRLYPVPVYHNEEPYYDGAHSDPIPIRKAISDGYEDIVVILTRPLTTRNRKASWLRSKLFLGNAHQARRRWRELYQTYNRSMDVISKPPAGVKIQTIAPSEYRIGFLGRSQKDILAAIAQGKEDAREQFLTGNPNG